jgi:hypothetical protein
MVYFYGYYSTPSRGLRQKEKMPYFPLLGEELHFAKRGVLVKYQYHGLLPVTLILSFLPKYQIFNDNHNKVGRI